MELPKGGEHPLLVYLTWAGVNTRVAKWLGFLDVEIAVPIGSIAEVKRR